MYALAIWAAVTGSQYWFGFSFFILRKSLNSGGVVAFIVPSFLLSFGRLEGAVNVTRVSLFSCL